MSEKKKDYDSFLFPYAAKYADYTSKSRMMIERHMQWGPIPAADLSRPIPPGGPIGWKRASPVPGYIIHQEEKPTKAPGKFGSYLLADGERTAGVTGVNEVTFPAGQDTRKHINHFETEMFYIFSGSSYVQAEGISVLVGPGTFVFAARGRWHRYLLAEETHFICTNNIPAGFEYKCWPGVGCADNIGDESNPDWGGEWLGSFKPGGFTGDPKTWDIDNVDSWMPACEGEKYRSLVPAYGVPGTARDAYVAAHKHGNDPVFMPYANRLSTAGEAGVTELNFFKPGYDTGYHINHNEDIWFYVLDGEATFTLEDSSELIPCQKGAFVFWPRGRNHQFVVTGDKGVRMLMFNTPGGFEEFYQGSLRENLSYEHLYALLNMERSSNHWPKTWTGPKSEWKLEPKI